MAGNEEPSLQLFLCREDFFAKVAQTYMLMKYRSFRGKIFVAYISLREMLTMRQADH